MVRMRSHCRRKEHMCSVILMMLMLFSFSLVTISMGQNERNSGQIPQTLYKERLKYLNRKSGPSSTSLIDGNNPPTSTNINTNTINTSTRLSTWRNIRPTLAPFSARTKTNAVLHRPVHKQRKVLVVDDVGDGEELVDDDHNANQSGATNNNVRYSYNYNINPSPISSSTVRYISSTVLSANNRLKASASPLLKSSRGISTSVSVGYSNSSSSSSSSSSSTSSNILPIGAPTDDLINITDISLVREDDNDIHMRMMSSSSAGDNIHLKERLGNGGLNLMGGFLKREIWTIPLLAVAGINVFLIALFEIYVLCRVKSSRSNLFLGQSLLFGLFLCSSLSLIFVVCPSVAGCYTARVGLGLAYTIIFSVLMVKLATSYQASLLFFSILVQVVINIQWVIAYPPHSSSLKVSAFGGQLWSQCGASFNQLLITLSYNGFLIVFVGILSFRARKIRENYRESIYIGFSILITVPIWASWIICGYFFQAKHLDACLGFGMLAQSISVFLIMYLPKGRQLAAMGKEGMYIEDQEDQCSGTGYSPSFFHFKPPKVYKSTIIGEGNVYTTLEPTLSTLNPNVFFHRSDFHPGMIY